MTPVPADAPPHSDEAEVALLGALLRDNRVWERVSHQLQPDHFANRLHGRVYDAIGRLIERGQIADPITLKHAFAQDPDLQGEDGISYLRRLAVSGTTALNAPDYARAIVDLYLRRQLIDIATDIAAAAHDGAHPVDARGQIEAAESRLYGLVTTGAETTTHADIAAIIQRTAAIARREPVATGVPLGLSALSRLVPGALPGQLLVLAARPSMGKSALALTIAESALSAGRVLFFSLEMSSQEVLGRRIALATGIPTQRQRIGPLSKAEAELIHEHAIRLGHDGLRVIDRQGVTAAAIRSEARRFARRGGLSMIVIDYLGLIGSPPGKRDVNRVQEIGAITAACKGLAKDLQVPVLLLSQLNRGVEQREDKRPHLADLRDSGAIEQDADVVMLLHREEYYLIRQGDPTKGERETNDQFVQRQAAYSDSLKAARGIADVIVAKHRDGECGSVRIGWESSLTKFHDLSEDVP